MLHSFVLIGVVGVLLDIVLHVLQMFPTMVKSTVRLTAGASRFCHACWVVSL